MAEENQAGQQTEEKLFVYDPDTVRRVVGISLEEFGRESLKEREKDFAGKTMEQSARRPPEIAGGPGWDRGFGSVRRRHSKRNIQSGNHSGAFQAEVGPGAQGDEGGSLLEAVDHLSTVSGGGYIGAWLVSCWRRIWDAPDNVKTGTMPFLENDSRKSVISASTAGIWLPRRA